MYGNNTNTNNDPHYNTTSLAYYGGNAPSGNPNKSYHARKRSEP